jgi:putative transposase
MILELLEEATTSGARREQACAVLGITVRAVQRWESGSEEDLRCGPHRTPANALTDGERRTVVEVANAPEYRNLSPKQIVPRLADLGKYYASESTFVRVLRDANQLAHRGRAKPPQSRPPREHIAVGPNRVFSWDITYLPSTVRGKFYYLYMIMDVWSRKVMGWAVHDEETSELASALMTKVCTEHELDPSRIVLHSDNGGPMKGATMLATLQRLGVMPSFSRPHVSNDNPFSEALFRTLKYCPWYPSRPFGSVEEASAWVADFVTWYNTEHRHSGIRFVTPDERHSGREEAVLSKRRDVYDRARRRHPERWTTTTRNWTPVSEVQLNPSKTRTTSGADSSVGEVRKGDQITEIAS